MSELETDLRMIEAFKPTRPLRLAECRRYAVATAMGSRQFPLLTVKLVRGYATRFTSDV